MKIIYRDIKKYIEDQGYQLLSSEYVNSKKHLLVRCAKKHEYKVSWNNFHNGCRCPYCAKRKITYKQVRQQILQEGYKLLSRKYVNAQTKILVKCSEGHQYEVVWNSFQQGSRCPECYGNKKLTYRQVKKDFEKEHYKLLSKEYLNCKAKLLVLCSKGHRHKITRSNFQRGHRCPQCKQKSRGEKQLYKLLKQVFPDQEITRQDSLGFLKRQTVDFAIKALRLAFEYDGVQHFEPIEKFGGLEGFDRIQKRDQKKNNLCKTNGYQIIRFRYDLDLGEQVQDFKQAYKDKNNVRTK